MFRFYVTSASVLTAFVFAAGALEAQPLHPDVSQELQVARQVMESPGFQSAVEYLEGAQEETVQEWLSLCNAYGPQGDEIYRSRLIRKLFRIYGLEMVRIDDARNVIGVRRGVGDGPTVVLNSHMDDPQVYPKEQPIEAFVADDRVWCPAAGDGLIGTIQLLTALRAMNAGNIETQGDVWFVTFTEEEVGSTGVQHFIRGNYPHNIDWRNGDILAQFHGSGGDGTSTGSSPYIYFSQLRVFVPLDWQRWRMDAVDALGPIITGINEEVRDSRTAGAAYGGGTEEPEELLQLNMSMVRGDPFHNGTADQAWIRFDMRSHDEQILIDAGRNIERIAARVCEQMGEGCLYAYEVNMKLGVEGLEGFDKGNFAAARMAAAAGQALYGTQPMIDPTGGCGDCRRSYMGGMPMMSFRGRVLDHNDGNFEILDSRGRRGLQSRVRRKSSGHDDTASAEIVRIWAAIRQGVLFATAYTGPAN
jgi:acetylornithine deacetylase/succinyl-diaminopimelate desuccinylase-like protein